jgi:hypothetical protein
MSEAGVLGDPSRVAPSRIWSAEELCRMLVRDDW